MSANVPAIQLEGVTKSFDGKAVVDNLTVSLESGKILGLIGPSGSGKTTCVRLMLGVHTPDKGRIQVLGREPRHFGVSVRERIGYMPQHFVLYPELSVRENLDFIASCYGVPLWGRAKRLSKLLEFVELTEVRHTAAGQVSGGQQRRLELACTLVHDPWLIVMDEPTAGIDPVLRAKFWEHFRELRDQGRTILVTTQYVTEAEYCDEVAALRDGKLVAAGPPDDVRRGAMGGELLTLHAPGLGKRHLELINGLAGVRAIKAVGPDEVLITVDNAGQITPQLTSALQGAGLEVANLSEYRPNFDEVFVRLMETPEPELEAAMVTQRIEPIAA
jgi:ABC-2 type transport system ATP-binding protein